MASAVLGGLLPIKIGAFGVKNGVSELDAGSRVSRAGRKDFRNERPVEVFSGMVS